MPRLCEALWSGVCSTVERRGKWAARLFRALLAFCGSVRRLTACVPDAGSFAPSTTRSEAVFEVIGCGGAHLDPELARRLEALGWTCSRVRPHRNVARAHVQRPFEFPTRLRRAPSCGRRSRDPRTDRAASEDPLRSEPGEIVARGASVFRGYRGNDAATQAAFTADGWFRTGDLGWIDVAGYLHVVGRSKELIALADGKKVFPEELEKNLPLRLSYTRSRFSSTEGASRHSSCRTSRHPRARRAARGCAPSRSDRGHVPRLPPYQRLQSLRGRAFSAATYAAREAEASLAAGPLRTSDRCGAARTPACPRRMQARWHPAELQKSGNGSADGTRAARSRSTTSPQLDLDVDSLEWVALTLEIEERFGVALTGDAVSRILTVRDLLHEIEVAAPAEPGAAAAERHAWVVEPPSAPMRALGAAVFALAWVVCASSSACRWPGGRLSRATSRC